MPVRINVSTHDGFTEAQNYSNQFRIFLAKKDILIYIDNRGCILDKNAIEVRKLTFMFYAMKLNRIQSHSID